jgi:hypothetical protein
MTAQNWIITAQKSGRGMTKCKRIKFFPQEFNGEVTFMPLKIKLWQIIIKDLNHETRSLKIKLSMNEINTPTFIIEHPPTTRLPTIRKGDKDIPIPGDPIPVKGETERFHNSKDFRQKLAAFGGMKFANEVIGTFIECTPFGDAQV